MFKKHYIINGELIVEGVSKKWFNIELYARPGQVWDEARTGAAELFKSSPDNVRILGVFKL